MIKRASIENERSRAMWLLFVSVVTFSVGSALLFNGEWIAFFAFSLGYFLSVGHAKFSVDPSVTVKNLQSASVTDVLFLNGCASVRISKLGVRVDFYPDDRINESNLLVWEFPMKKTNTVEQNPTDTIH